MKRYYFIGVLLLLSNPLVSMAQKNDLIKFINWFIVAKKPDSIGIVEPIDISKISITDFIRFYGVNAADTNAIKKQLAKTPGSFNINKIKGVIILSADALAKRQAAYEKQFPNAYISYFSISQPIFLPNGRILIKLRIFCGELCGNEVSYIYKKTGNTYTLIRSDLISQS
jgi:hypothetical protein